MQIICPLERKNISSSLKSSSTKLTWNPISYRRYGFSLDYSTCLERIHSVVHPPKQWSCHSRRRWSICRIVRSKPDSRSHWSDLPRFDSSLVVLVQRRHECVHRPLKGEQKEMNTQRSIDETSSRTIWYFQFQNFHESIGTTSRDVTIGGIPAAFSDRRFPRHSNTFSEMNEHVCDWTLLGVNDQNNDE